MAARNWLFAALLGAGLAGSACAIILGAEELPQGNGGSGTASSSTSPTGSGSSGSSGKTTTASGSGTSSTASSGGGACVKSSDCIRCEQCMEGTLCNADDAGCPDGSPCGSYAQCLFQCTVDASAPDCVSSCSSPPTGYTAALHDCVCEQCKSQCVTCQ